MPHNDLLSVIMPYIVISFLNLPPFQPFPNAEQEITLNQRAHPFSNPKTVTTQV